MRAARQLAVLAGILLACSWSAAAQAPKQKDKDKVKVPQGWVEYQPEGKQFSVLVPEKQDVEPTEDKTGKNEIPVYYSWTKGDARMTIIHFTERKGEALKDNAAALNVFRNDIDIVKGTLKDVKLDGVPGIEYMRKESDGTNAMYRVYRSADGKTAATLMILKADKLTPAERTAFLSSFKFTKPKK